MAEAAEPATQNSPDRTAIAIEALSRLKGIDLDANPAVKAAVLKVLDSVQGSPQFVELVREFRIKDQHPALLELAARHSTNSTGVEAARLILDQRGFDLLKETLQGSRTNVAIRIAEALGNLGEKRVVPLLEAVVTNDERNLDLRKRAVISLAQTQEGAATLLDLARTDKLAADLRFVASSELNNVRWPKLKAEAAQLLPLPQSAKAAPLPPLAELMKSKGDPKRGSDIFSSATVGCVNCHQVNGRGIDFGPNLSEIGTKLGKDALYVAILDPSAGISFGYEAWLIELKNGDEAFGLIASETADELAVKAQTAIVTRYQKSAIAKRTRMTSSVMPSGLQQAMSVQDLVDLVEYLSTLKKASLSN